MGPLLLLLLGGAAQGDDPCCDYQKVSGQGQLDGDYTLESSPTLSTEEACMNSCIYKKLQDSNGEYCFRSSSDPGDVTTCTALPTDAPITGSTLPPSEENLNNEKRDLEQDLITDENDLVKIQEEENDAAAVDSELDKAQETIDRLTGGEATTASGRVKRQAAQNCQEIATLVDEIKLEKETKKKLKIIQRITTTTITECTEGDKKILIQKKEVIRIVKIEVQDEIVRIKEKKVLIKIKIFTKKKKIKNILAKIEAILATTQKPELTPGAGPPGLTTSGEQPESVPTEAGPPLPTGESPTGGAPPPTGEQLQQVSTDEPPPTEEQPKPMQTEEPPIPTGEQPKPMPTGGLPPTGEQPYAMTTEEPGEQPKPMQTGGPPPTGEQPAGPNNEASPLGSEASKPTSTNAPPPLVSGPSGTEPAPPPPAI